MTAVYIFTWRISNYFVNNKIIPFKKKSHQASAFHMQNISLRVISRILPGKKFSELAWQVMASRWNVINIL